ncbi:MAG: PhoPQ-activated pathogenicity-related family protein [Planctomycetes bacterium]|jgi:PhoPQ-activated pathogenicity-related protein|nr:PhoPQ-activated pathogenicity-related family protein [Planctomycetota bacterium]
MFPALRPRGLALAAILVFALPAAAFAADPLRDYVQAPDASFAWEETKSFPMDGASAVSLKLTSQTWRGIPWVHRLVVIRPDKVEDPKTALLVITGGSNKNPKFDKLPEEALLILGAAKRTGTVVAVLGQVPNQPLFDGLGEDALIAYTFKKYLEEKDPTWPALLPMTKSAVRAMDAVQAFLDKTHGQKVERFVVTGASKRGWTTWLTTACDPRVCACAPMVIDVLNMRVQMKHQLDTWGAYSDSIHDYSDFGILQRMTSPEADPLLSIVDPYAYRERLAVPKLVFLGSNDPYWPVDAAKHYFFDLPGEKHLTIVPNAGHGLDLSAVEVIAGFYETVVKGAKRPAFSWMFDPAGGEAVLTVCAEDAPLEARLWTATAAARDFRKSKWESAPVERDEIGVFVGRAKVPESGSVALFMSLSYKSPLGSAMRLCTNMEVFPPLQKKDE